MATPSKLRTSATSIAARSGGAIPRAAYSQSAIVRFLSWPAAVIFGVAHVFLRDDTFTTLAGVFCGCLGALTLLVVAHTKPRTLAVRAILMAGFYVAMGAPVFARATLMTPYGHARLSSGALESATFGSLIFAVIALLVSVASEKLGELLGPTITPGRESEAYSLVTRAAAIISIAIYVASALSARGRASLGVFGYVGTLVSSPAISMTLLYLDAERSRNNLLLLVGLFVLTMAGL